MRLLYKITLGFLLISLLVGIQAYIGYNGANSIQQRYNEVSDETLPVLVNLNTIRIEGLNIIDATNEIIQTSPDNNNSIDQEINKIAEYSQIFERSFEIYENKVNIYFPGEKEYIERIGADMQDIMRLSSELIYLKKKGNKSQIKEIRLEFAKSKQEFITMIDLALENENDELKKRTELTEHDMEKLKINSLIFGLISFFSSLILSLFLSHHISNPIVKLKNASYEIGKGNFDTKIEINTNDEIEELGNAFNQMRKNLKDSLTENEISNEKIARSLEEKEVLFREIHHRVKNNMQIVSSLLNIQSQNIEDKKYKDLFIDSQNRILSMSFIHEKLYQSENFAQINFKEYINEIVSNIFSSYSQNTNIKIDIDVDDIQINMDYAVPCGLIINELVTNSFKYAFPDGRQGKIQISAKSNDNNMIQLSISDDGIGIPKDLDIRNTKSLGLDLVTSIAEGQLQGEIILNREKGTEFQINFRYAK